MAAVVLVFLCVTLSLVILNKIVFLNRKRAVNLPPLAAGALPIVGHTFLVLANRKRLYKVLHETILGPVLKRGEAAATLRIGTWDLHMVLDPDDSYLLANSCLKKESVTYGFFKPLIADNGLVTADVPVWKRHRKLLNPTFNQSVLDTYLTEFNDRSQDLVKDLSKEMGNEFFDPLPYLRRTVLHVVSATIMGVSVDEKKLTEEFGKDVDTFISCMVERITKFWYHSDFLYSLSNLNKEQHTAAISIQNLSYKIMSRMKAKLISKKESTNEYRDLSKSRFKSFLELLLELPNDDALTEVEVLEEVNTFIIAGFDTTYHAIGNTLLTLGSYPEVQKKVFEELQEIFNETDREIEKQDLSKMKYLEAVIKETMRLYPIVSIIGRKLDTDLNFKNYTLPAGSKCFTSIYHVCRHPVWGPDAEQFRPERWLDGSLPNNSARAYAVFGLGKRSCIGANFAMTTMKTILTHVVRRYRISGDVTQLVQKLDIVVTPVSGHHISIEQRTKSL